MNRTSVKHRAFTVEPMRDKGITSLPGIGSAYSAKLSEAGFSKATNLYGQYLVLDRNEGAFTGWLKNNAGMSSHHASSAFKAFSSWEDQYFR